MALLILFSSSGMSLDVHFCQGEFKRANIFGKAKTCEEVQLCMLKCGKTAKACHAEKGCGENGDHEGCCNNENFELNFDFDAMDAVSTQLSEVEQKFIAAFTYTYLLNYVPSKGAHIISNYKPPPLEKDIALLFQVFRL